MSANNITLPSSITLPIEAKRMLDWREAQVYTGLGRTRCRDFCEQIGAIRKVGKRILFDRKIIDAYFDDGGNYETHI